MILHISSFLDVSLSLKIVQVVSFNVVKIMIKHYSKFNTCLIAHLLSTSEGHIIWKYLFWKTLKFMYFYKIAEKIPHTIMSHKPNRLQLLPHLRHLLPVVWKYLLTLSRVFEILLISFLDCNHRSTQSQEEASVLRSQCFIYFPKI